MHLPISLGNAIGPKQNPCYRAIAIPFEMTIERSNRERKPLAPLERQGRPRSKKRPFVQRRPEPMRGTALHVEIRAKRQFEHKQRPLGR
jgi:hypothetical protein